MAAQNGDILFPRLDNGSCMLMGVSRKSVIQLVPHALGFVVARIELHPLGDLGRTRFFRITLSFQLMNLENGILTLMKF